MTVLAGLGGGLARHLHRRRAARAPRALPARRARRVPARRAARRRADRLRPRHVAAGGRQRARAAAGRPGRRPARRQRHRHGRPAVGGRRRQVAHDDRLAGRRARRRPPRAGGRGRLPHQRADPGARLLEGGVPPPPAAARCSACRSTCPTTRRSRPRRCPRAASFERPFVRDKDILQREAKDGAAGLTLLGYGIVLAITLSIIALNAWALVRLATVIEDAAPEPRALPAHARRAGAGAGGMSRALRRKEIRLHGHPVSYYEAGSGPVLLLVHGITSSADAWRSVMPALARALHGGRAGPARPRRLGQAARRLLARRLRQRPARPAGRARARARDRRRPLDGRRHRDGARLPVPRARGAARRSSRAAASARRSASCCGRRRCRAPGSCCR